MRSKLGQNGDDHLDRGPDGSYSCHVCCSGVPPRSGRTSLLEGLGVNGTFGSWTKCSEQGSHSTFSKQKLPVCSPSTVTPPR